DLGSDSPVAVEIGDHRRGVLVAGTDERLIDDAAWRRERIALSGEANPDARRTQQGAWKARRKGEYIGRVEVEAVDADVPGRCRRKAPRIARTVDAKAFAADAE